MMEEFKTMVFIHPVKSHGHISRDAETCMQIWDFVKTCSTGDIAILFDTGVFDPIVLDYLYVVLRRLLERESIEDYHAAVTYNEMKYLLRKHKIEDVYKMKQAMSN